VFLCVTEFIIKEEQFLGRFIALLRCGRAMGIKMGIQFGDKGQRKIKKWLANI